MTDTAERRSAAQSGSVGRRDHASQLSVRKDAATLILVDRSGRRRRCCSASATTTHKFMPGKFVFPGGRVEPNDDRMPVAAAAFAAAHRSAADAGRPKISRRAPARSRSPRSARPARRPACCLGKRGEAQCRRTPTDAGSRLREAGLLPDLVVAALRRPRDHAAAAASRRFDTRFFAADAVRHRASRATASSMPTQNWSNWSGCRSRTPRRSTCRRSRAWCWRSSRSAHRRRLRPRPAGPVLPLLRGKMQWTCCRNRVTCSVNACDPASKLPVCRRILDFAPFRR